MSDSFVFGNQCDSIYISFDNWSPAEQGWKDNITNSTHVLSLINDAHWIASFLTETCFNYNWILSIKVGSLTLTRLGFSRENKKNYSNIIIILYTVKQPI